MSNDRYERIRKALAMGPTKGPWGATHGDAYLIAVCNPDTIRELLAERDQLAAALEDARLGLRYVVRVWVLSDEIVWSEEKIDEVVEDIIADAKKEKGKCLD